MKPLTGMTVGLSLYVLLSATGLGQSTAYSWIDTVETMNGTVYCGQITKMDEEVLVIKTSSGTLRIPRSNVRSFRSDSLPSSTLNIQSPIQLSVLPHRTSSKRGVLNLIEAYKAPPFPRRGTQDWETYDHRILHGAPVPETLTDTFVWDLWQIMIMDLGLTGVKPHQVTEGNVMKALNAYLTKDWTEFAGYRPWTHMNFVKSLSGEQRSSLCKEVAEYMSKSGIRDGKDKSWVTC